MAYATTKKWVERAGLGIRIVDENVGTGDNSETDFDLDKTNIFASTYTLSHAASGSNTFTTLTETTHYTLDKESGRIVLTAGGVTEVGTDIIYATYWYTDNFADAVISDMIDASDDEIEIWTGRKWDTPSAVTEYADGRSLSSYPTTDRPFQPDWDRENFIVLKNKDVTTVDNVYFLAGPQEISLFLNFDSGTSAYTDKTTAINSITESPFNLFDDAPATGDIIYIGMALRSLGLDIVLSTAGADNGSTAIDWEYWNGTAWTDLTETDVDTGASIFTTSGKFTWTYPYGWEKTTVNSSESLYFIRGTLTDDYGTDPIVSTMTLRDSINTVVEQRQVLLQNNTLNFMGIGVPNGTSNVRVDYNYGQTTTPSYIEELSILMTAVKAYVNLSGGSYNDATSYTLGSKAVTIGEVYVNIREVIDQFKKRIDEIQRMIGRRAAIVAI